MQLATDKHPTVLQYGVLSMVHMNNIKNADLDELFLLMWCFDINLVVTRPIYMHIFFGLVLYY